MYVLSYSLLIRANLNMNKQLYRRTIARLVYIWMILLAIILTVFVYLGLLGNTLKKERLLNQEQLKLIAFTYKAELVMQRLTDSVIYFSLAFEPQALANYWDKLQQIRKIDAYMLYLKNLHSDTQEINNFLQAKKLADSLREDELKSIKLVLSAYEVNQAAIPAEIQDFYLTDSEKALTKAQKLSQAAELVHTKEYLMTKEKIRSLIQEARQNILKRGQVEQATIEKQIDGYLLLLKITTVFALFLIIIIVWIRGLSIRRLLI